MEAEVQVVQWLPADGGGGGGGEAQKQNLQHENKTIWSKEINIIKPVWYSKLHIKKYIHTGMSANVYWSQLRSCQL